MCEYCKEENNEIESNILIDEGAKNTFGRDIVRVGVSIYKERDNEAWLDTVSYLGGIEAACGKIRIYYCPVCGRKL